MENIFVEVSLFLKIVKYRLGYDIYQLSTLSAVSSSWLCLFMTNELHGSVSSMKLCQSMPEIKEDIYHAHGVCFETLLDEHCLKCYSEKSDKIKESNVETCIALRKKARFIVKTSSNNIIEGFLMN